MQRSGSFASDQQVQDLLSLAYIQRERNAIPRVDSVRSTRSPALSIEATFLCPHPEAATGCELAITLAIRFLESFPHERPMIACIAGGEHLPARLCDDGQLSLPWLRDGWPHAYTLAALAQDICACFTSEGAQPVVVGAPAAVSPTCPPPRPPSPLLLLQMDSPPKRPPPSAPTYRGDGNEGLSPSGPVTFKCKWRNTQCAFQARPPQSLASLFTLLSQYIPSLAHQRESLQLVEFNSSRTGALLSTEQQWQALVRSNASTVFILINECKKDEETSVDLLGLHDDTSVPTSLVHPLRSAPRSPNKSRHGRMDSTMASSVRHIPWTELEIGKIVGNGSSCRVYNATWRGTDVAVKVFTGTHRATVEKEFGNEVATMTRLGAHPSLVLFLAVTQRPLSIVFEFLPFSLFELINGVEDKARKLPPYPTSWTKRVTMMLDVAKGLQFLHSFDIIHRDLKSLNLLVTPEGRVKLADFGISRVAQTSDLMTGCCGTFQWMAPEVLQSAAYSVSADIYSFGIIMWEICEAAPPFTDLAPALVPAAVLRDKKRPPFSARTPMPLQELAQRCWQEDAAKRPRAAEVATTLNGFFYRS